MTGSKALAIDSWCAEHQYSYTRFDYRGHGQSDGAFLDGCITDWLEDTPDILDHVVAEPCIIIGSSMGGWLALLAAIRRPKQIRALVGIAAAPDFTERLMWQALTNEQKQQLTADGIVYLPSCSGGGDYAITKKLIEDGRDHLLLQTAPPAGKAIDISCPVRLLHGMADEDVPWQISTEIAERIASHDVVTHLIKNAGHRMSEPAQLTVLLHTLGKLVRVAGS